MVRRGSVRLGAVAERRGSNVVPGSGPRLDVPGLETGGRPALPEDKRLGVTVQVRLTAAEKRELAELADRLGVKPSTLARRALHAYVAEHRAS